MQIDSDTVDKKSGKGRPPTVRFQWGDLIFDGVISNLSEKLTLFLPANGKPVRAVVDLTLTQIRDDEDVQEAEPHVGQRRRRARVDRAPGRHAAVDCVSGIRRRDAMAANRRRERA